MSADRFKISDYGTKLLVVDSKDGDSVAILRDKMNSRGTMIIAGAIRQQARDIDQLRTDLAAAVAERDEAQHGWEAYSREIVRQSRLIDEFRARLAAIESAPTVARVGGTSGRQTMLEFIGQPPIGTELIARPAKD